MMKYKLHIFICLIFILNSIHTYANKLPIVELQTTKGTIEIELLKDDAPITVANFLSYVESGYYNGLIFHRIVHGWLIQGGGYDLEFNEFETNRPIRNEANNGLKNIRGTIAMARMWKPHSADSQFFINLSDNPSFDYQTRTPRGFGYCVFGRVVKGMEVVDAIGKVATHERDGFGADVPVEPVIIESANVLN